MASRTGGERTELLHVHSSSFKEPLAFPCSDQPLFAEKNRFDGYDRATGVANLLYSNTAMSLYPSTRHPLFEVGYETLDYVGGLVMQRAGSGTDGTDECCGSGASWTQPGRNG